MGVGVAVFDGVPVTVPVTDPVCVGDDEGVAVCDGVCDAVAPAESVVVGELLTVGVTVALGSAPMAQSAPAPCASPFMEPNMGCPATPEVPTRSVPSPARAIADAAPPYTDTFHSCSPVDTLKARKTGFTSCFPASTYKTPCASTSGAAHMPCTAGSVVLHRSEPGDVPSVSGRNTLTMPVLTPLKTTAISPAGENAMRTSVVVSDGMSALVTFHTVAPVLPFNAIKLATVHMPK